jgi:hypothetical protein
MQSRLSPSQSILPPNGQAALSRRSVQCNQTVFEGTISSACDFGIGIDNFIAMTRLARRSDPRAARFMDAWDALAADEQQSGKTADAVCEQLGLDALEVLRAVADTTIRFSMYSAQIAAAVALPSVVGRSIEVALTDKGIADRKMQFQHSGFLPTPSGAQTNIAIMQNAQLNATAQHVVAVAPRPEETIRRLSDRLNEGEIEWWGEGWQVGV